MNATATVTDWTKTVFRQFPAVKRVAEQLYRFVPARLRLGKDFWTWLAFLEASEQWTTAQIQEYQMTQLRQLLTSLKQMSPYYARVLANVNITEIRDLADFQRQVPTLQRSTVRDQFSYILSTNWQKHRLSQSNTSGTTGLALQFYHLASDSVREWASICHQWRRVGFDPLKSVRAEFRGLTTSPSGVDVFPHLNMIRCSILDLDRAHLVCFADEIQRTGVTYFHGYPSALYLLARGIENSGISFPQPKGILLASEMVYEWQLDALRNVFPDARLYAHYGCAERAILAGWCEHQQTYHVLPQYSLVEVDPETNEIIGTNLYNIVNGFVRYRMTDTVLEPSWDKCAACHRPYIPRFDAIGGRTEDFLFSPERGWIPPAIVTYPFKALKAIRETQIYQPTPEEIVINFVADKEAADALISYDQEHISKGMIHLFGKSMIVKFARVETIVRSKSGKFKWIISDLDGQPYIGKQ